MPLYLTPPREGQPNYRIRGQYLNVRVDRTAGTPDAKLARAILKKIQRDIESGAIAAAPKDTFTKAAKAYLDAGHSGRFLAPIVKLLGDKPLADFADRKSAQIMVDTAATALYPNGTPATRRRQLYTPIKAVCSHVGIDCRVKNPKGAVGAKRERWLTPEEAFRLVAAAEVLDSAFHAMVLFGLYTGARLGEMLALQWGDVNLPAATATIRQSKTDTKREAHLPPIVVAALGNISGEGRVFGFVKGVRLRVLWNQAAEAAVIHLDGVAWHALRHTWATWMRRHAGATTDDLLDTGAWADRGMASRYAHADTAAAARLADKLPMPERKVG